ncbi:MAG: hypothetical protein MK212_06630 [Saprospiraceae bacterium]|nr:hypothetical protein [Saprospiraceae bacterium]
MLTSFDLNNGYSIQYKIDRNGKISFVRKSSYPFDLLISVFSKNEKIRYESSGLPKQDYVTLKKGIIAESILLEDTYKKQAINGQAFDFGEDSIAATKVFEFLADRTFIEWSLLIYGDSNNHRSKIYTSYYHNLEYFGAKRAAKLANATNISFMKHYHSHPRYDYEAPGKYAFPSHSDLKFRDQIQSRHIEDTEFKIRTEGMYIDYGNPSKWNMTTVI